MKNKVCIIIGIFLFASACNHKQKLEFSLLETQTADTIAIHINNIPTYESLFTLLKEIDIQFQSDLMLNQPVPSNIPEQEALQTGILIADLCYLRYFDQVNLSLNTADYISQRFTSLSIPHQKVQASVELLENNLYSQDSALILLTEAFNMLSEDLILAERNALANLLIAGVWIENGRLMLNDTNFIRSDIEIRTKTWNNHISVLPQIISSFEIINHPEVQKITELLKQDGNNSSTMKNLSYDIVNIIMYMEW
jgi:hypothetical protein